MAFDYNLIELGMFGNYDSHYDSSIDNDPLFTILSQENQDH